MAEPDELRDHARYLRTIVETAEAIVLELDTVGRVVYFNQFAAELLGVSLAEVQGQRWIERFVPEADRVAVEKVFREAIAGASVRGFTQAISARGGQQRVIQWSATLLCDEAGDARGLLSVGLDVTELEAAAEAARRREARLSELIETTQDGVIFIDSAGRIQRFNRAAERMFGYERVEILGEDVARLMPEPYASEHRGYVERYEATGERRAIGRIRTVTARRKSGEVFPIELSVTELPPDDSRYAAFIRDISDKVSLQQQLLENERMAAVGATASVFAHEVGNPLNNMYLYAQLLKKRLAKAEVPEELHVDVESIMNEVQRLSRLLDEFRSFYRQDGNDVGPTDLRAIVEDVCRLHTHVEVQSAQLVRVECQFRGELPVLHANADRLRQVLVNLVKNAVEAMPDGGSLVVRASQDADMVRIEVQDTGPGIDPSLDVFQPFRTTKARGTGLGLPVVRQIVTAHGGSVHFASVPGEGTTFTILLPIATPSGTSQPPPSDKG